MPGSYEREVNLAESLVTPAPVYRQRRKFMQAIALPLASLLSRPLQAGSPPTIKSDLDLSQANSLHQISHYNNYFEFSTSKQAVAILAQEMSLRPWTLEITGEVQTPLMLDIDTLLAQQAIVERIYRFRCVEGWAMVIPWQGIPLCDLLRKAGLNSRARYVQFISRVDDQAMIGLDRTGLKFPYREALRIDEAMHPLTLLASGLYGKPIPAQNGAPLRLVVPWKYGFKSAKAITKIILTEDKPVTSWNEISPQEYGFFANVNPQIAHPRWSQRRENKIGELKKQKTRMFNGYQQQVASLYHGMDLEKNF